MLLLFVMARLPLARLPLVIYHLEDVLRLASSKMISVVLALKGIIVWHTPTMAYTG